MKVRDVQDCTFLNRWCDHLSSSFDNASKLCVNKMLLVAEQHQGLPNDALHHSSYFSLVRFTGCDVI